MSDEVDVQLINVATPIEKELAVSREEAER